MNQHDWKGVSVVELNNFVKQFEHARGGTLRVLDSIPAGMADVMPPGFRNTIRWNAGHILVVAEQFLFGLLAEQMQMPKEYKDLFGNGTKPADWTGDIPSLEVLVGQLKEQGERAKDILAGRSGRKLAKPYPLGSGRTLETSDDVFNLALYHEANHTGYIQALKRTIEGQ
ncbi:DinB family protein [Aneurinibacillus terranovensis]|uniref:DinB family protein n=1 Tax=Aneurinibacillus terranovensis TaxID=278991 RepID=UPI000421D97B|nr:DinB family protein [Aneurinibacillus terranovensis]